MRFAVSSLVILAVCSALACGEKQTTREVPRSEPQIDRTLLGTEEQRQLVTDFVLSLDGEQLSKANGQTTRLEYADMTPEQQAMLERLWTVFVDHWTTHQGALRHNPGPMSSATVREVAYYHHPTDAPKQTGFRFRSQRYPVGTAFEVLLPDLVDLTPALELHGIRLSTPAPEQEETE